MLFRGLATNGSTWLDARTSLAITVQLSITYACTCMYICTCMIACTFICMYEGQRDGMP